MFLFRPFHPHWRTKNTIVAGTLWLLASGLACKPVTRAPGVNDASEVAAKSTDAASEASDASRASLDSDGDGIVDAVDACPRLSGYRSEDVDTNGCPPCSTTLMHRAFSEIGCAPDGYGPRGLSRDGNWAGACFYPCATCPAQCRFVNRAGQTRTHVVSQLRLGTGWGDPATHNFLLRFDVNEEWTNARSLTGHWPNPNVSLVATSVVKPNTDSVVTLRVGGRIRGNDAVFPQEVDVPCVAEERPCKAELVFVDVTRDGSHLAVIAGTTRAIAGRFIRLDEFVAKIASEVRK